MSDGVATGASQVVTGVWSAEDDLDMDRACDRVEGGGLVDEGLGLVFIGPDVLGLPGDAVGQAIGDGGEPGRGPGAAIFIEARLAVKRHKRLPVSLERLQVFIVEVGGRGGGVVSAARARPAPRGARRRDGMNARATSF